MSGVMILAAGPIASMITVRAIKPEPKMKPHILGFDHRKSKGEKARSRKEHRERYRV